MSRLTLSDTAETVVVKMVEGNPGAVEAIVELMLKTMEIDPQAMLGPMAHIMALDTHEIYGTDIYILYNDKCNRDVRKLIILLRATQLGFMTEELLKDLSKDQIREVNLEDYFWESVEKEVLGQLEDFQR